MPHLEEVWLNENLIENIKSLEKSTKLKALYLGGNRIRRIRGLDHLSSLEILWLDENKIEVRLHFFNSIFERSNFVFSDFSSGKTKTFVNDNTFHTSKPSKWKVLVEYLA